jgi:very-short-patch-repair endonuclease
MKSSSTHRSLKLRSHAAGMRNELATASERALWQRLRARQLGVHFRRRVPLLGRYIVDFLAPGARLVVEVDGGYHGSPATRRAAAGRDRRLSKAGLLVLRLSAELLSRCPGNDEREVVASTPP